MAPNFYKEDKMKKIYIEDFTKLKGLENSMFKISSAEYRKGSTEKVKILNKETKSAYKSTGDINEILDDLKFLGFDVAILKNIDYNKLKEIMVKEDIVEVYTINNKVFCTKHYKDLFNKPTKIQGVLLNNILKKYGYKISKDMFETFQDTELKFFKEKINEEASKERATCRCCDIESPLEEFFKILLSGKYE